MGRKSVVLAAIALAIAGGAAATKSWWLPQGAVAQAPAAGNAQRAVSVTVAPARKKVLPVVLESLGTVTPMASVAIKARVDSEITGVHFADGARVKQGDILFTLDSRSLQA